MAKPDILPIQSVLGTLQYTRLSFQPYATNSPYGWTLLGILPPGMSVDGATGFVTGIPTNAGTFNFALTATNTDGTSDAMVFTIGVYPNALNSGGDAIDLEVDVVTGAVRALTSLNVKVEGDEAKKPVPIIHLKYDDIRLICVFFVRNGIRIQMTLTSLKIALRDIDEGIDLLESNTGDWKQEGTDENYFATLAVKVADPKLMSALAEHEDELGTYFVALTELEWQRANPVSGIGNVTLRTSSQTFGTLLPRDFIQN